jgi:hypothetical protein
MELKEMTLFEAADYLDLEVKETTEGLRLFHGSEDPTAYVEVTLVEAEEGLADSHEAYARMLEAKYSPMINKMVGQVIVDSSSAWTVVAVHLKTLEAKEK